MTESQWLKTKHENIYPKISDIKLHSSIKIIMLSEKEY